MKLISQLKNYEKRIGVWGLGYIGYSSMAHFCKQGIKCIGTDVDEKKVNAVNTGESIIPNIENWLGFNVKPLVKAKLMTATTDWNKLISEDVPIHLVCIPTERHDEPFDDILIDVITKISKISKLNLSQPPLVIIESTITPDRVDKLVIPLFEKNNVTVGKDLLLGVAPRRDWFAEADKTLRALPRVVGGTTPEATEMISGVLGIVCEKILKATDHFHAAIVKAVENAYRCVEIQLANELSLAFPDKNITEVLELASTKWNMGSYHPSVGIGGYCIPIAPKYIIAGATNPNALSIFKTTLESTSRQSIIVADNIAQREHKRVGILGLAYKGDLKVHILSPTIAIVKRLKELGIAVKVSDPYYTSEEIKKILDVETFEYPDGMVEFDTIVLVSDHILYETTKSDEIIGNLKNCRLIIDNMGSWKKINFDNLIEYHEVGDKNWLLFDNKQSL